MNGDWQASLRQIQLDREKQLLALARRATTGEAIDAAALAEALRLAGRNENDFGRLVELVRHRHRLLADAQRGSEAERKLEDVRQKLGQAEAALAKARARLEPQIARLRAEADELGAVAARGARAAVELHTTTPDPVLRERLGVLTREREALVERAGELRRVVQLAEPKQLRDLAAPRSAPGRPYWTPTDDEVRAETERRQAAAAEAKGELEQVELRLAALETEERQLRTLALEP